MTPFRLLLVAVLFYSCSIQAHHSVSANYNQSKTVTMELVVEEFRFINPHPYLSTVLVGPAEGVITLELDNRRELVDLGFNNGTFISGDSIFVTVYPGARNARIAYVIGLEHSRLGFKYVANQRYLTDL